MEIVPIIWLACGFFNLTALSQRITFVPPHKDVLHWVLVLFFSFVGGPLCTLPILDEFAEKGTEAIKRLWASIKESKS